MRPAAGEKIIMNTKKLKTIPRRSSITARITILVSFELILIVMLTFLMFRFVSASILQRTVRGYLLGSVNANIDKIRFIPEEAEQKSRDNDNTLLLMKEGSLEIDDDFLDEIYDVQSALYREDGTLLYGKNPLARSMDGVSFTGSRIYRYRDAQGGQWYVYDRKLSSTGTEKLWIRGMVSLSSEEMQLHDIFRTAFFFIPVLIFLGIFFAWITAVRALSPLRKIRQTVAEITQAKDLHRRIDIGEVDSELYDLSESFNSMLDRLEHSFEAEQQFTSDASHELRTPVTVIMAQAEMALEKERSQREYVNALAVILRQGRRMNELIASMLDYTRMALTPENYPLKKTDLTEIVYDTAQDLSLTQANSITMTQDIEDEIFISGNRLLLERALQNLIDNAYKYGRENGNIHIELKKLPDGTVRCSIADDGIGISAPDLEKIFDRFYRGDSSRSSAGCNLPGNAGQTDRRASGVGLGLSMVSKIMEIHHGSVTVRSTPGQGSTFTLIFPDTTIMTM